MFLIILLFAAVSSLIGCKSQEVGTSLAKVAESNAKKQKKKKKQGGADSSTEDAPPAAGAMQIPIGTVHMVDEDGRFILIKSGRRSSLDEEAAIYTYGQDAQVTSTLKASPASKGSYLTADMVEGIPSVGDIVMIVHTVRPPRKPESDESGLGGIGSNSDVQVLE